MESGSSVSITGTVSSLAGSSASGATSLESTDSLSLEAASLLSATLLSTVDAGSIASLVPSIGVSLFSSIFFWLEFANSFALATAEKVGKLNEPTIKVVLTKAKPFFTTTLLSLNCSNLCVAFFAVIRSFLVFSKVNPPV